VALLFRKGLASYEVFGLRLVTEDLAGLALRDGSLCAAACEAEGEEKENED